MSKNKRKVCECGLIQVGNFNLHVCPLKKGVSEPLILINAFCPHCEKKQPVAKQNKNTFICSVCRNGGTLKVKTCKKDDTGKINPSDLDITDYPFDCSHIPELAPVIRYCNNCKQNRTRNINGNCITCGNDLTSVAIESVDYIDELIGQMQDLKNEFILLESIRQTAKELLFIMQDIKFYNSELFESKKDELTHLVITD